MGALAPGPALQQGARTCLYHARVRCTGEVGFSLLLSVEQHTEGCRDPGTQARGPFTAFTEPHVHSECLGATFSGFNQEDSLHPHSLCGWTDVRLKRRAGLQFCWGQKAGLWPLLRGPCWVQSLCVPPAADPTSPPRQPPVPAQLRRRNCQSTSQGVCASHRCVHPTTEV